MKCFPLLELPWLLCLFTALETLAKTACDPATDNLPWYAQKSWPEWKRGSELSPSTLSSFLLVCFLLTADTKWPAASHLSHHDIQIKKGLFLQNLRPFFLTFFFFCSGISATAMVRVTCQGRTRAHQCHTGFQSSLSWGTSASYGSYPIHPSGNQTDPCLFFFSFSGLL